VISQPIKRQMMQHATPNRVFKGANDIRTHSGSVGRALKPHEIHIKLCALEIEKTRRVKEKESALQRIKIIDSRFNDLEKEEKELLHVLEKLEEPKIMVHPSIKSREQKDKIEDTRENAGGFKIRY
jgi:hypothetical protein